MKELFERGIFTAKYNECGTPHWQIVAPGSIHIGIIDEDGSGFSYINNGWGAFTQTRMLQIVELMADISTQYKQLQTN